ncbi:hypothetical protein [Winogradskyella aurantia]|uniref:Uncharacterized protein n=1 Tax=Winogradskyella aurantia TaxID=1915063 RepID=A0A265UPB6_9FLAO|nr:hypothetical protein [Winogradskyella aurantia]OZV67184.1 hypothetical protein CA834_12755 [Winogradskyella aurantia]
MKNLILPFLLFVGALGFSQSESIEDMEITKEKVERLGVVITVDSLEELESTFNIADIKNMFDLTSKDKTVSFELVCNGEPMSNGKKSHMSYKIEGSSNDEEAFLKRVETIKKVAIKHYKKYYKINN